MKTVALFLFALVVTTSALEEQEEVGVARIIGDSINLSSFMSSGYGVLGLLIVGFLILDIVLGAVYFGGLAQAKIRRRNYRLRNNHYAHHYGDRHYRPNHYGVGRIGPLDDPDALDNAEALQNQFAYQSLDLVDTTFGILNVESEPCRARAICQIERSASQNAVLSFLTKNLNSYINGLERYEGAVQRGRAGESCEEIYSDCLSPINETWKLFRR